MSNVRTWSITIHHFIKTKECIEEEGACLQRKRRSGETPQARGGLPPSPQESKRLQRKGTVSIAFITPHTSILFS